MLEPIPRLSTSARQRGEETTGMDLALTEIAQEHFIVADACGLTEGHWTEAHPTLDARKSEVPTAAGAITGWLVWRGKIDNSAEKLSDFARLRTELG